MKKMRKKKKERELMITNNIKTVFIDSKISKKKGK